MAEVIVKFNDDWEIETVNGVAPKKHIVGLLGSGSLNDQIPPVISEEALTNYFRVVKGQRVLPERPETLPKTAEVGFVFLDQYTGVIGPVCKVFNASGQLVKFMLPKPLQQEMVTWVKEKVKQPGDKSALVSKFRR